MQNQNIRSLQLISLGVSATAAAYFILWIASQEFPAGTISTEQAHLITAQVSLILISLIPQLIPDKPLNLIKKIRNHGKKQI